LKIVRQNTTLSGPAVQKYVRTKYNQRKGGRVD